MFGFVLAAIVISFTQRRTFFGYALPFREHGELLILLVQDSNEHRGSVPVAGKLAEA
jgi:hypothetical protein